MEEGKNIFLLDGPIGRKKLLIFLITVIVYTILFAILLSVIFGFIGMNIYTKAISKALYIMYMITVCYVTLINYSKRLWDIINCSKWKALLYVVLFSIAVSAMGFIPILKYISKPIGLIVVICLILIKGHLNGSNEAVTEANAVEEMQDQA